MSTHNYQDLIVWQKSMDLAEAVYKVSKKLPVAERFALTSQIRRAVISVPSNIAEGQKRIGRAETIHFTGIALGSAAEVETQLILCQRLHGLDVEPALQLCVEVSRMLTALLKSLRPVP